MEIEKKTNVVIKGSKKIRTKKNEKAKSGDEDSDDESKNSIELDIYQYPIIEFSEEEKKSYNIFSYRRDWKRKNNFDK